MAGAGSWRVHITLAAWQDIGEIVDWIADHDSPKKAGHVLERILNAAEGIALRRMVEPGLRSCPRRLAERFARFTSSRIASSTESAIQKSSFIW
jgi:plasmid stabilization system protein ParE